MKKALAGDVVINHATGDLAVDGVTLPWHLAMPGPTVQIVEGIPVVEVSLTLIAEGNVTIIAADGVTDTWDPELGSVRAWAANHVREGLQQAFPWLDLPKESLR